MVRKSRREIAIPGRGNPRELPELALEVRLVAVAGLERHIHQRGIRPRGHEIQGSLEAEDAAVELRAQADGRAEDLDEPPMAVAALLHHAAHLVRGGEAL